MLAQALRLGKRKEGEEIQPSPACSMDVSTAAAMFSATNTNGKGAFKPALRQSLLGRRRPSSWSRDRPQFKPG